MTSTTPEIAPPLADAAAPAVSAPSRLSALLNDRMVCAATIAIIAALYLFLQNPYWVPGGDSEVYLATAQNLARGHGYLFNGQPARIAPPGWPLVLAGLIKYVSPEFWALKLVTMGSMVAAMAIYYWIVRRFVPPITAAMVILMTAMISHVYSLTFWLHSDALFTLITAAMLLVAIQINESGARSRWKIALLLGLCVAAAFVRWAGILNVVIVAAALISGRDSGSWVRRALAVVLVVTVTSASFVLIRLGMRHFAPERVPFEATAQMDMTAIQTDTQLTDAKESQAPDLITGTTGNTGYVTRIIGFGTWFSYLLWQPFRLATGIHAIWWIATIVGWVVLGVIGIVIWPEARSLRWLLPATLGYTFLLCLNWPHATARYLVPIAPLLVLMIVRGLQIMGSGATRPWQKRAIGAMWGMGMGSILLCNLALWGIDVWVMRSRNFYDRYEAGMYKPLLAAATFLSEHSVGNWQTCVNPEYINYNKRKMSPTGLRIVTMLTGKAVLQLPKKYTAPPYRPPNDREFRKNFIARNHVRYYLEQPPVNPWRLHHFRVPWLQEKITGNPVNASIVDGWRLYVCDGASTPVQVALPEKITYPTRVPGF